MAQRVGKLGGTVKTRCAIAVLATLGMPATVSCSKQEGPVREAISHKDDYKQAYIYGSPR